MIVRIVCALIAIALVVAFVLPPALKLKHVALAVVIGIGLVMILIDAWQSLRENE